MGDDLSNCPLCPYYNQAHLANEQKTMRSNPPVPLEDNNSNTLLIFQAPGIEEWISGVPIQPTRKKGGTAGARVALSWKRQKESRTQFDIINVVQCYPGNRGNDGDRDDRPHTLATCACSKRLQEILAVKNYSKIIVFGEIAGEIAQHLTGP